MKPELDLKEMGKRIRNGREAMALTREELAEKLSISNRFCAEIEEGTKGISLNTLLALSIALNLSTDYLLKGNEAAEAQPIVDETRALREKILIPLESCTRSQLRRVEEMVKIFVAAVQEEAGNYGGRGDS